MGAGWGDMCWAKSAHDASFDDLRSFHPQIFARPQEHESLSVLSNFVRVSAQLNMKIVSLSDYDAIVTAISGFFLLPKSSLVPRPFHVFQRCTRKIGKAWSIW